MSFDGIDEVVLPAADIRPLARLYTDLMGFTEIGGGPVSPSFGRLWGLPLPPSRDVLLGKPGTGPMSGGGSIRLVEVPGLPPAGEPGPPDRCGPYALDFFLRDAVSTELHLEAHGVAFRTEAAAYLLPGTRIPVRERIFDQRASGLIHATIQHRPSGTRCVLDSAPPSVAVSECVALIAVTDDPAGAAAFATAVLGAQRYFAGDFAGPDVMRMLHLHPADHLPIQLFRGPASRNARLEFATRRRPGRPADPVPRAIATCRVSDVDGIAAMLRDGRHGPSTGVITINQDDQPTRRLCLRSRYGLVFDLVER